MKKTALRGNILLIVLAFTAVLIASVAYFKIYPKIPQLSQDKPISTQEPGKKGTESNQLKSYVSQDLKISFMYPKGWFVDEKDFDIMVTSYQTRIGENKPPNTNEIKIFIDNYSGCHDTIEENLIDPACGEGGPSIPKNKIISKEMRQTEGGTYYKYIVETPNKNFIFYLLEKEDRVLQIEKTPDPSQFEKEFEGIINSIRFL